VCTCADVCACACTFCNQESSWEKVADSWEKVADSRHCSVCTGVDSRCVAPLSQTPSLTLKKTNIFSFSHTYTRKCTHARSLPHIHIVGVSHTLAHTYTRSSVCVCMCLSPPTPGPPPSHFKWILLLLLLVKKLSSSFVETSQGAVFYAHRSERLWFADCCHIFYFSQKKRHVKIKKQWAQII